MVLNFMFMYDTSQWQHIHRTEGPRMEPWITPEVIGALEVEATLTTTEKVLFEDSRWQFKSYLHLDQDCML